MEKEDITHISFSTGLTGLTGWFIFCLSRRKAEDSFRLCGGT